MCEVIEQGIQGLVREHRRRDRQDTFGQDMITFFTIIFVVCCLILCVLILLQSSKGGLGAGLGGGGSQSTQVFGGQGAGGFLARGTILFSSAFMILSLVLAHLSSAPQSIMGELDDTETVSSEEDEVIEEGTLDLDPGATGAVEEAPEVVPVGAPTITPPAAEEAPAEEEVAPADGAPAQDAEPEAAPAADGEGAAQGDAPSN